MPATDQAAPPLPLATRTARKLWREVSRPFRRLTGHNTVARVESAHTYLTGTGATIAGFHP